MLNAKKEERTPDEALIPVASLAAELEIYCRS